MLERCYRELGDGHALAMLFEAGGRYREAREEYALFAGRSPENRARLLAEAAQAAGSAGAAGAAGKGGALAAGLRYSALALPEKAGRLLLKAGAVELAAEDFERAGSWDDLAECREALGQHLQAARALARTGTADSEMAARLHRLLLAHLEAAGEQAEGAAEEMYREAVALRDDGQQVAALARFRLLGDTDSALELMLGLGWYDEAVRVLLGAGEVEAAARCAGSEAAVFAAPAVVAIADELAWPAARQLHLPEEGDGRRQAHRELLGLLSAMLGRLARGTPREEAAAACAKLVSAAFRLGLAAEELPTQLLDLVVKHGAAEAARAVLEAGIPRRGAPPEAVRSFAEKLSSAARAAGGESLAPVASWALARMGRVRGTRGHGGEKSVTLGEET
jgi:hypothetical protein